MWNIYRNLPLRSLYLHRFVAVSVPPVQRIAASPVMARRDGLRKYYRFRPSRFYGGISTADCVGCCLRCVFCWSWNVVTRPTGIGAFHSPEDGGWWE